MAGQSTYMRDWSPEKASDKEEIVSEKFSVGFWGKTVISLMANHPGAVVMESHAIQHQRLKRRRGGIKRNANYLPVNAFSKEQFAICTRVLFYF